MLAAQRHVARVRYRLCHRMSPAGLLRKRESMLRGMLHSSPAGLGTGSALACCSLGIGHQLISAPREALCEQTAALLGPPVQIVERSSVLEAEPKRLHLLVRGVKCVLRAAYLSLVFGPLLILYPLSRWSFTEDIWWALFVRAVESSGALLIKLAQWASSRPDTLGEQVCSRLKHLQDNTRPHGWAQTEQMLDSSFGTDWREYLELERTPIGSGCIAQVYRGKLRAGSGEGGEGECPRMIAVKVLHPYMQDLIEVDMDLLALFGQALQRSANFRWLNPAGMLDDFAELLLMQLDLRVEASNLEAFRRNFPPTETTGEGGAALVCFPEPVYPFVSRDVLVESYIDGVPWLEWAKAQPEGSAERKRLCNDGIDVFIKMLFVDNFVHGDLHPGNIMIVNATPGDPGSAQLAFLDAGIAVAYAAADHEHLIDVLTAFIQYDGYEGGRLMAENSADVDALRDLNGFCEKIQTMVELARDSPTFFDQIGDCISIICEAACDHKVKMKNGFISIALSVKVVEGSVIQVDPRAIVAPRAKPVIVREHMRRKGYAILGRSLETGELEDNDAQKREKELVRAARERAAVAGMSIRDEYRARHPRKDGQPQH